MIRNAPFLHDGTPMPTRYWLVGADVSRRVSQLESRGGVRAAEAAVDPDVGCRRGPRPLRRRAGSRHRRLHHTGPRPVGRCRRHPHRREVPARALRLLPRRRRRPVGRWVDEQLTERRMTVVAAVDCGTNSTRLLISDGERTRRTPHGDHAARQGRGRERAPRSRRRSHAPPTCCASTGLLMDQHGVTKVARHRDLGGADASNRDEFFGAAEQVDRCAARAA